MDVRDLSDRFRSIGTFFIIIGVLLLFLGLVIKSHSEGKIEKYTEELFKPEVLEDESEAKEIQNKIEWFSEQHYWSGVIIPVGITLAIIGFGFLYLRNEKNGYEAQYHEKIASRVKNYKYQRDSELRRLNDELRRDEISKKEYRKAERELTENYIHKLKRVEELVREKPEWD